MGRYSAVFRCIGGCGEEYPLDEVVYNCRKCGNLLEVSHDMDLLRHRSADEWKELFSHRMGTTRWPFG
ncbi:MAG TPA: threonine synthase, partial [Spirochaetota bacterium]|nr:threonine synthase [Spirochaetota bacterium]